MRVENSSSPSQQPNTATLNQPTIEGISSPREMSDSAFWWKDPTWRKILICGLMGGTFVFVLGGDFTGAVLLYIVFVECLPWLLSEGVKLSRAYEREGVTWTDFRGVD